MAHGAGDQGSLGRVRLADYGISGESIVCFAGEDWWYHHPHSKNHILKRLAKDNKVLFVNSISFGLPSVSNPDFFLKIRRKFKSYLRTLTRTPEGLWVISPVTLPFYGSRVVRWLNKLLLALQLNLAMCRCSMRSPIIWIAIPSAADAVRGLSPKLVIYQVSDKYDANEDSAVSKDIIRDFHRRLVEMSSVVMYSGRKLYDEAAEMHKYYLEQAVDFEHMSNDPGVTAPDIARIPKPVLGFVGWMDYVMDLELIQAVAERRPDWHWAFVGTKNNLINITAPNLHFLGPKPYGELPSYLRHFDVCILPYSQHNEFTQYGSAIKVKEYLATGKPVVISPLYEYLNVPGIRIYRTVDDFIAQVEDALSHDTPLQRQLRQDAVRNQTWETRARQVGRLISSLLSGSEGRSHRAVGPSGH